MLADLPCGQAELPIDGAAQDVGPGGEEVHAPLQVLHPASQGLVGFIGCRLQVLA